ncbi:transcription factor 12-like isoform X3 [Lytechinus variegatus]|uniref:transcription factor 12-like isoform X3 n=1 Tax=Lytechinus variegatus TaxID=7654 RepID=UPI001BB1ADDB|nr:transcription factor 12-like isoform X3 [Lytechinus variegatus]
MDGHGSSSASNWNSQGPAYDTRVPYEHGRAPYSDSISSRGMESSYMDSSSSIMVGLHEGKCEKSISGKSKDLYSMPSYSSISRESGMGQINNDLSITSPSGSVSPHTKPGSPYMYNRRRSSLMPDPPSLTHKRRKAPGMSQVYSPGAEDYHSDPNYSSPKPPGMYPEYFMEGSHSQGHSHSSTNPWSSNGMAPTSNSFHSLHNSSSYSQAGEYPTHEPMYQSSNSGMSSGHDPLSLPPMTTFRPGTTNTAPYTSSPPINGTETVMSSSRGNGTNNSSGSSSHTGAALGKALASIYSADHPNSTYPSNPSTPVGSPPPHSAWQQRTADPQTSPGPYSQSHLHSLTRSNSLDSRHSEPIIQNLYGGPKQIVKQTRMEERLDDAINVLQKHAQSSVDLGLPVGPMGSSGGLMPGATSHSGSGPMGANISSYAGHTGQYLDSHMPGGAQSLSERGSMLSQDINPGQPYGVHGDMMGSGLDNGLKSSTNTKKKTKSEESKTKGGGGGGLMLDNDRDDVSGGGAPSSKKGDANNAPKNKKRFKNDSRSGGGGGGAGPQQGGKSLMILNPGSPDESDDEGLSPEQKQVKEKERRHANNARERIRVRDINEAFKELGRMCQLHLKQDKAQTKLTILHSAVSVITTLEHQVRERNLNPKAACLKRREEEKVEEMPNRGSLGGPGPGSDPLVSQSGLAGNNLHGRGMQSCLGQTSGAPTGYASHLYDNSMSHGGPHQTSLGSMGGGHMSAMDLNPSPSSMGGGDHISKSALSHLSHSSAQPLEPLTPEENDSIAVQ